MNYLDNGVKPKLMDSYKNHKLLLLYNNHFFDWSYLY